MHTGSQYHPKHDDVRVHRAELARCNSVPQDPQEQCSVSLALQTFDGFTAAFGQRMRAAVSPYPGIASAPRGRQSVIMVYGFTPGSLVTFSVSGPAALTSVEHMDEYGNAMLILGSGYPAGSYSVGVLGGDGKVRPMYTFTK